MRPIIGYIANKLRRRTNRAGTGLARLNLMIQDNADGIAVIDDEGVVRFVNPAAEAMLGKSSTDMVGQLFGYSLQVGISTRLNIIRPGEERSVSDLRVVETEIDGEHGYLASFRDVTAQVKAEEGERLRARELNALARIVEILVQPRELTIKCTEVLEVLTEVVQADFATVRVLDARRGGLRLVAQGGTSSVSRQSVLSMQRSVSAEAIRLEHSVVANDYPSHPLAEPQEVRLGIRSVVVLPIKSQGEVIGVVNVISQRNDHFNLERVGILAVVVDGLAVMLENVNLHQKVSEGEEQRRRAEETLRASAQAKMSTLGEVATGVDREIGQPLTNIGTMIQSLQEDLRQNSFDAESALAGLGALIGQVDRMTEIVGHLRTFGHHADTAFGPVALTQVVDGALSPIAAQMRDMEIDVQVDIEDGLPDILGNAVDLEQALTNLFQNSIHAVVQKHPRGGAEIKVTVALVSGGETVHIEFSDNGIGLAPADLDKIFEPFFSAKEAGNGAGFGLFVVYGIIQGHNGTIQCQSELNEGTTMTLALPVFEEM